ncbi:MAG: L-histidine N(alpha)-methyltransferase [Ginsengibacter sp.]
MNNFLTDVLNGLQSSPKYLFSKYFYDKKGDELFQKIMDSPEYYLTNAEMEIFSTQTNAMACSLLQKNTAIDILEFGPGDATKSVFLLKELSERNALINYFPIDISKNIIDNLNKNLPKQIPGISIHGFVGEYFEMLTSVNKISTNNKLVLFLGGNIGNFKFNEMPRFCKDLRNLLLPEDMVLIGFDLKKNPKKILAAYNDKSGYTAEFNLNLLRRINEELNANFDTDHFEHYPTYDPQTGACKSFLISTKEQEVKIENTTIKFEEHEPVFMEISQKYSLAQINEIMEECGFHVLAHFFDSNNYFVDIILKVK